MFNAEETKNRIIAWIKDWFENNGKGCNAIIGLSGGTDSSVVAALLVEALGKDRVFGVMMPDGKQEDIMDAVNVAKHLGIKFNIVNISGAVNEVKTYAWMANEFTEISEQTMINIPPRIRMATLYAISQSKNGRVANTCNLSEDWIGYNTLFGDSAGDFSPLSNLTKTEVKQIGRVLGLPDAFVDKVPTDGLCGLVDEEKFGFTYDVLDRYIRTGEIDDVGIKAKIDAMHEKNLFKLQPMASFKL